MWQNFCNDWTLWIIYTKNEFPFLDGKDETHIPSRFCPHFSFWVPFSVFFVPLSRPEPNFHISSLSALLAPTTPPFPGWLIPAHPPPAIWYMPNLQCKPNLHHTYTYFVHWCTLYIVPHISKTASFLFERTPQLPLSAFSEPGLKTRLQRLTFSFHNSLGKVLEISVKAVDTIKLCF